MKNLCRPRGARTHLFFLNAARIFSILIFCICNNNLLHAQTQLEMSAASYPSPPSGSTIGSQTATLLENTAGTTFAAFSPAITYTLSYSKQQYTSVTGISTGTGLSFGTTLNGSAKTAIAASVVNALGAIGTGVNGNHTSSPSGIAGTGIDVAANFGFRIFAAVEPLYAAGSPLNGRYYYGDLTVAFNRPVSDPVLQVVGLGGSFSSGSTQGFSMEYELQTTDVTLSKLSGSTNFNVTGNKILNAAAGALTATCGTGAACGSAKVAGTNITVLVFKLFIRGDGLGAAWSGPAAFSGEASTLSITMNKPVTISGTILNDFNGATDALVNGTGTNAGGTLSVNLADANNNIVTVSPVAADGTYSFAAIGAGNYTVSLSTSAGTQGFSSPSAALPPAYANTGEGIAVAGDGTPNGATAITVASTNITGINFGINRYPLANSNTVAAQVNPGGTAQAAINTINFSGTDPDAGGQISAFLFTAFPANVTSIKIAGTIYTAATFPVAGVMVAASGGALAAGTVSIDPVNGLVTSAIPYKTIDAAGLASAVAANVFVQFTTLLPLRFVDVSVKNIPGKIVVQWITADEVNANRFDIQKSVDGMQWSLIGTVAAKPAGGTAMNNYRITDFKPADAGSYYRIKEIDKDGGVSYSDVVKTATNLSQSIDKVTITPNPAKDLAAIEIQTTTAARYEIIIVDASGRKMQTASWYTVKGINRFVIKNMDQWPGGLYYIIIRDSTDAVFGTYQLLKK